MVRVLDKYGYDWSIVYLGWYTTQKRRHKPPLYCIQVYAFNSPLPEYNTFDVPVFTDWWKEE